MIKKLKPIAAVAAGVLALNANANAAVDLFLVLEGIQGESQDAAFKGAIDVLAWSWGMSQSGTTHEGAGGGAGKASYQDISFTHYFDSSSVDFFSSVATGTHIPTATLSVRKAGEAPLVYIEIVMENIIVTSASTGGSGGEDRLTENITLNFSKFTTKYTKQNPDGSQGATMEYCFDIAANVQC